MGKTSYTDRPAKLIQEMRALGHNVYQLCDQEIDYKSVLKNIFLNLIPKTRSLKEMPVQYPPLMYGKYTRKIDKVLKKIHFQSLPHIKAPYPHSILNMFLLKKYLHDYVKRNKIDVVIFFIPQSGMIASSLKELNVPLVFDHEDPYTLYAQKYTQDGSYKDTIEKYEKYCLEQADLIVTVGHEVYINELREKTPKSKKIISIHHGYDDVIFNPTLIKEETKKLLRKELQIEERRDIIIYIGRLDAKIYRVDLIPYVAKCVIEKGKNPLFLIVGEGNYLNKLKEDIIRNNLEKNFLLIGHYIPQNDVAKYLAISDVFLFLTIENAHGPSLKIFEILAMNKPIIMTDMPDAYCYIQNGINGYFVSNEPYEIADKICELLNKRRIVNNLFIQEFTWKKMAEKYIEEIIKVIEAQDVA